MHVRLVFVRGKSKDPMLSKSIHPTTDPLSPLPSATDPNLEAWKSHSTVANLQYRTNTNSFRNSIPAGFFHLPRGIESR